MKTANSAMAGASESSRIAVIGMGGRLPGASSVDAYWRNLLAGGAAVTWLSTEQLQANGLPPEYWQREEHVPAAYLLDEADKFDHLAFGYSPREAKLIDPQQRVMLECAGQTLEHAGYGRGGTVTGVFVGASLNTYLLHTGMAAVFQTDPVLALMSSDKDFLATRVAYKFDLRGPCVTVQTACSTSLTAVHMACQSLLAFECDSALAGGVCVKVPIHAGYHYRDGGMLSKDGLCRPFDAQASGTVFGSGVGLVMLKREADAIRDRDCIHALIEATAVNNDGARKGSYTAPSVAGISEVMRQALDFGQLLPRDIGYIECHGTGTALGDPIEVQGLRKAFATEPAAKPWCWLGSVKGNIGHLEAAAGIAGLLKAVHCVKHGQIPATQHFQQLNPSIDLQDSPFEICAERQDWSAQVPRRAAVVSLGVGGTNAVALLGEAAKRSPAPTAQRWHCLPCSARTEAQLQVLLADLQTWLHQLLQVAMPAEPVAPVGAWLADAAFTLTAGRMAQGCRALLVVDATGRRRFAMPGPGVSLLPAPDWELGGAEQLLALDTDARAQFEAALRWLGGSEEGWEPYRGEARGRIPLPTTPWARVRLWRQA